LERDISYSIQHPHAIDDRYDRPPVNYPSYKFIRFVEAKALL